MTGVVAPSTDSAPPLPVRRDPNFSGEWTAVRHDNLEALLRAQEVPDRNIPQALTASNTITQHIHHTSDTHTHPPNTVHG